MMTAQSPKANTEGAPRSRSQSSVTSRPLPVVFMKRRRGVKAEGGVYGIRIRHKDTA